MPGFRMWKEMASSDSGPRRSDLTNVANSMTIYAGDPVVGTTVTSSQYRLRKMLVGDISALYQDGGGNVCGIFGISAYDMATDSAGAATTIASATSLAANVKPNYAVPSIAAFEAVDPVSGRLRACPLRMENMIAGALWESTTVTETLVGVAVGILISTISGQPATYFWSSAATTKIGTIQVVDESDPLFNTTLTANVQDTTHSPRVLVGVKVQPAFNQLNTLFPYLN